MATRLPLELLHEIILLNDDHIDHYTGTLENNTEYRAPTDRATNSILSFGRRPKKCARTIGLVCMAWHSFVKHSPRLWLCRIRLSLEIAPSTRLIREDFSIRNKDLLHNNDIDIDLYIRSELSERGDALVMEMFVNFLLPNALQWRSLRVDCHSPMLWLKIQEKARRLPRMIHLHGLGTDENLVMEFPRSDLSIPRLRFADVTMANIGTQSHLGSLSATQALRLRWLCDGANTEELIATINLQLPFLVHLRLDMQAKTGINTEVRHSKQVSGNPLLSLDLSGPWPDVLTAMLGLSFNDSRDSRFLKPTM